jgi:alkylhydroperoxidase family enzyme
MHDPYAELLQQLAQAVLSGPGRLAREVRQAAASSGAVPAELESYVQKVAQHAYRVTDADVAALRQAGYTEDQLFELTVSVALGAGLARLKAGQAALEAGGRDATA